MWEPRRLTTLWTSTACYRNSFNILIVKFITPLKLSLKRGRRIDLGSGLAYKPPGDITIYLDWREGDFLACALHVLTLRTATPPDSNFLHLANKFQLVSRSRQAKRTMMSQSPRFELGPYKEPRTKPVTPLHLFVLLMK
jgi:hypothetical protein